MGDREGKVLGRRLGRRLGLDEGKIDGGMVGSRLGGRLGLVEGKVDGDTVGPDRRNVGDADCEVGPPKGFVEGTAVTEIHTRGDAEPNTIGNAYEYTSEGLAFRGL